MTAPSFSPDQARTIALAVAGGRVVLGLAALATPSLAARPWIGADSSRPGTAVLGRALGGRDIALGLGALIADRRKAPLRGWVEAAVLSDAGDAVATLASFRDLPKAGRVLVLAASAGAAVAGALAARCL